MHRYIEQLIEDFRQRRQVVKPPHEIWDEADPTDPVELEDISYVEAYLYGDAMPVSDITGIDQIMLPPADKLTSEQAGKLAIEMELLLNHFHLFPDFPAHFSGHLRYPFLYDLWNNEYVSLSFGENHIEFCSYDESECPFPGYCTSCEEFRKEKETGAKAGDLPEDFDVNDLLNMQPPF